MEKAVFITVREQPQGKASTPGLLDQAAEKLRGRESQAVGSVLSPEYDILEVQYNPASIQMSVSAGSTTSETTASETTQPGQDTADLNQVANAQQTSFSVELIFDGPQTKKSMEKCRKKLSGKETKAAIFCWGEMAFPGTVTQLGVTYTMFDDAGSPAAGKMKITLNQTGSSEEQDAYWEKAYQKIM